MYLLLFVGAIALIGMFMYNGLIKFEGKGGQCLEDISVFLKKNTISFESSPNTVKGMLSMKLGPSKKVITRNQAVEPTANVGEVGTL